MNKANITPCSVESEQSLLGCILIDNKTLTRANLPSQAMYDVRHEVIFRAMLALHAKNSPIDLVTLSDFLEKNNLLERVGGRSYLVELTQVTPAVSHVAQYAKIVYEKFIRRNLIKECSEAIQNIYDEKELSEITETIKKAVIGYHQKNYEVSKNPEMTDNWLRDYATPQKPNIKTGMNGLDFATGGIANHQLSLIVANSNVGKTTFALNMALNMSAMGKKVLFFSLEMPAHEIIDKCIAITGNHSAFEIYTRQARQEMLLETVFRFQEYPITIVSKGNISSQDVVAESYAQLQNGDVDVIFVDYLNLLNDRSTDGEVIRLTRIAQALKNFSLTYNIPIISPTQVDKESSKSGVARLENIGGAKAIGDTADLVLYLYEKENRESLSEEAQTELRMKVVKSRTSGKFQDFSVNFDKKSLKMNIE